MVEPAGADRDIGFCRNPVRAVGLALVEDIERRGCLTRGVAVGAEARPAGGAVDGIFVAHPMAAGTDIAEDKSLWLEAFYGAVEEGPIVYLAFAIGAFAAGTVEPLLEDGAVLGEGVFESALESLVIEWGAVGGGVAVPGRNVDAELEVGLTAGVGEIAEDIALTVLPMALFDSVGAGGVGPKAETVVMFGGDDDAAEASGLSHGSPLVAVEVGWIEDVFSLGAGSPFSTGEGVGAEMAEHIHFHALPT